MNQLVKASSLREWTQNPGLGETTIRLLEAGVGELDGIIQELRQVAADIERLAVRLEALTGLEWYSPAGRSFAQRMTETGERTRRTAEQAQEAVMLGRAGKEELLADLRQARSILAEAREAIAVSARLIAGGAGAVAGL